MRILFFLIVVTVGVALFVAFRVPGQQEGMGPIVAGMVAFFSVQALLSWHWRRISLLRYRDGNPEQALREMRLWRPLLDKGGYTILRAGMMAEAGLFDSIGRLLDEPGLPPHQREHARFSAFKMEQRWPEALEALTKALNDSPEGSLRTANTVEKAVLLAERFPERLEEAFQLYHQALKGPCVLSTQAILLSCEAALWLAADEPGRALQILQANTEMIEFSAIRNAHALPYQALLYQRKGRALALEGKRGPAQEALLRARETCACPSLVRRIDSDLAALKNDEPLLETCSDTGFLEPYRQFFAILQRWPGNPPPTDS